MRKLFKRNFKPEREMMKLRNMLDDADLTWFDCSDPMFMRTHIITACGIISIARGEFTYGGDEGLLEMYLTWKDDPVGWLTAKEAFEKIMMIIKEEEC